jgi:hypothetical protein
MASKILMEAAAASRPTYTLWGMSPYEYHQPCRPDSLASSARESTTSWSVTP